MLLDKKKEIAGANCTKRPRCVYEGYGELPKGQDGDVTKLKGINAVIASIPLKLDDHHE